MSFPKSETLPYNANWMLSSLNLKVPPQCTTCRPRLAIALLHETVLRNRIQPTELSDLSNEISLTGLTVTLPTSLPILTAPLYRIRLLEYVVDLLLFAHESSGRWAQYRTYRMCKKESSKEKYGSQKEERISTAHQIRTNVCSPAQNSLGRCQSTAIRSFIIIK